MCFVTVGAVVAVAAAESVVDLAFVELVAVEAPFDYSPCTDCSLLAVAASSCSDFGDSSYHTSAAVAAVVVEDTSCSADWGSSSFVVVAGAAALAACQGTARFVQGCPFGPGRAED